MTVRADGRPVPLEAAALRDAHPGATGRLAVFLHGLTETERAWCYRAERHHGRPGVSYGDLLRADLGLTPVQLRYNTGLHISDNGRALDALLDALVDAWPVPVQDVVLIGHSMGGLVARSALHQAGGGTTAAHGWTTLVRDTVTLGSPHLGAPLERGVHRLTGVLARLPETRALAALLALRSVGIKDLRRGTLVEADWADRDLDAPGPAGHTARAAARRRPALRRPRHPEPRPGERGPPTCSATCSCRRAAPPGDTGDDDRLAFPADHVHRLGGLNHLDLLNHPRVYEQLRRWLVERPEGARPAAPD